MELRSCWPPREQEPASVTSQSNPFQGSPGCCTPATSCLSGRQSQDPLDPGCPPDLMPLLPLTRLHPLACTVLAPQVIFQGWVSRARRFSPQGSPPPLTLCKITSPQLTVTCPGPFCFPPPPALSNTHLASLCIVRWPHAPEDFTSVSLVTTRTGPEEACCADLKKGQLDHPLPFMQHCLPF